MSVKTYMYVHIYNVFVLSVNKFYFCLRFFQLYDVLILLWILNLLFLSLSLLSLWFFSFVFCNSIKSENNQQCEEMYRSKEIKKEETWMNVQKSKYKTAKKEQIQNFKNWFYLWFYIDTVNTSKTKLKYFIELCLWHKDNTISW